MRLPVSLVCEQQAHIYCTSVKFAHLFVSLFTAIGPVTAQLICAFVFA